MARKRLFRLLILGFLWIGLSACQTSLPTVEVIDPIQIEDATESDVKEPMDSETLKRLEAAIATGMDDDPLLQQSPLDKLDPWELVERAQTQTDPVLRNGLLLAASKGFLEQGHISTAESMLTQIDPEQLNPEQAIEYQLTKARFRFLFGDPLTAQQLLNSLGSEQVLLAHLNDEVLELKADILTSQGQKEPAIEARLLLSDILGGEAASENLSKLHALVSQLSTPQLYQLSRTVNHADLTGWIDLIEQKRDGFMDETAWFDWQQQHPNHPASEQLFENEPVVAAAGNASRIALLLPLTSQLGRVTEAFRQGFQDAERDNTGQNLSRIYDIGKEFSLSPFYYHSAINNGADFVVGPLGRQAVQALHAQPTLPVATLFIGQLPEDSPHGNAWGLGLSPEHDAQAIAERAIQNGYRSAAVLRKNDAWGERVAAAFTQAFSQKGGSVKIESRFLAGDDDVALSVKNLLTINDSEVRHAHLEQLLGRNLQLSVRRRDDIDVIFVAASAEDARKLVPLLKFYRAHDLPLFAPSNVFSGTFSKINDADLNGLNFTDIPWLLDRLAAKTNHSEPDTQTPSTAPSLVARNSGSLKYGDSSLDRLYALGYAAYEVIPNLPRLQADPWQQFIGKTMRLRLDQDRNLSHSNAWGTFTQDGINVQTSSQ